MFGTQLFGQGPFGGWFLSSYAILWERVSLNSAILEVLSLNSIVEEDEVVLSSQIQEQVELTSKPILSADQERL